eukprot:710143-Pelagomonas_calceolata.AAC.2
MRTPPYQQLAAQDKALQAHGGALRYSARQQRAVEALQGMHGGRRLCSCCVAFPRHHHPAPGPPYSTAPYPTHASP